MRIRNLTMLDRLHPDETPAVARRSEGVSGTASERVFSSQYHLRADQIRKAIRSQPRNADRNGLSTTGAFPKSRYLTMIRHFD